ncbi:MAG: hypothetical protein ACRC4U_01615, partial [Shewanella sp.]
WDISHQLYATTNTIKFVFPKIIMSDAYANASGQGRMTVPFTSQAFYDTVTSKAIEIELKNAESATY